MKQDSEIGVALAAGHPCYFVGFLPEPMPGQTIEDVCRAEARFVEEVVARHPEAEGKPCLIGNCQAGWQIMMMAAIRPELSGPDHAGRLAALLLGRRARQEPDALSRRPARRHLADRAGRRSRQRHLRRRQPRRQLRVAATPPTPTGRSPTTSIRRSTPRRRASSTSRPGGAARCCSMPARCSGSPTISSSATSSATGELATSDGVADRPAQHHVADHRASAPGATTSRRRSRRWAGSLDLYDHEDEIVAAGPDHRLLRCTRRSAISASSSPARWRPRSTASSPAAWT